MPKQIFESLFKVSYPKGIGFAFSYRNPAIPIEQQRQGRIFTFFKHLHTLTYNPKEVRLHATFPIRYEVELGLMINKGGRNIPIENALNHVGGYFLCIDFTASENSEARKRGESWELYKNDDNYFPVSQFIEKKAIKDPGNVDLELRVNGQTKQKGNTNELIWTIPELISETSKRATLQEGDLFLTGTPAGSSTVNNDDRIYAQLSQGDQILADLNFKVKLER